MPQASLRLTPVERDELQQRVRSRTLPAEQVRQARLILMLAEGKSYRAIRQALGCNANYISRWKARFKAERLAGMYSRHAGRAVAKRTPTLEARILEVTRRPSADGSTHWSCRKLAKYLGVSHMMVMRVWQRAGLKPHRFERYMASDDPDFETKAADIIGLYVKPPQHAVIFCVDEKSAIQALDRLDPVLPLSPGRLERHGFEYYRHGTLSLYAALNTRTGEVMAKTAAHHTSQEFVAFLTDLVANQPRGKEIHIIADNLSAHKTKHVGQFLAAHPQVHLHYTPTYTSWLNQVENWFAKIEREVIARGVFTSVKDLARKLMRYIRHYNQAAKPLKWTYRNPQHRITLDAEQPIPI
ncbi:MAG: IS630 family transposase [Deltaproteobacteria bacterium]|nr:IS630 family transposase [Deltaproteobacteria bacterium]